ncbi:MAG: O-methyltransferase [Mycoplasma sp.]
MKNNNIEEIYKLSLKDNIPIIRPLTSEFIFNTISSKAVKNILEIGTAYGYSSALFGSSGECEITTLEIDEKRFNIAKSFLSEYKNITIKNQDCFSFETNEKFDLIFIDGPKRKQIDLINKYIYNLSKNGIIIIDNLFLKKFSEKESLTNNQKKILDDLSNLRDFILNDKRFNVQIFDIDDGIALMELKICN